MINNRNYSTETAIKLQTQRAVLYDPMTKEDWSYAHHASMAVFKEKLYAMWSLSRKHGDHCGQKIMYSYTENGVDWAEPTELVDSMMGERCEAALGAGGFHVYGDTLYAYVNYVEYNLESMLSRGYINAMVNGTYGPLLALVDEKNTHKRDILLLSSTDGVNWSKPRGLGITSYANQGVMKTATGRLILPGASMYPYTDDPSGQSGWVHAGLIPKEKEERVRQSPDCEWQILIEQGYRYDLYEASGYQTDDGVIHMLLRCADNEEDGNNYLQETHSSDNGETWSAPVCTEFTNNPSKFFCSRLPDGRYYIVINPVVGGCRCPLAISLSDDGENFDRHYIIEGEEGRIPMKFPGLDKHDPLGYAYSYPNAVVWKDKMHVITGANKETIIVTSFDLAQLK